ncbi:MAG: glycosyltransferase [Candidatus Altiarchaeota archaeon]|nr:glycosyltransferase [Candidatus Altiarchaeota archaeon]
MRVAMFSDTYWPQNNGVATALYHIHNAKKCWEDTIFSPIEHKDVITVKGLPFLFSYDYKIALNTGWQLRGVIGDGEFDVVHNHTPYNMFYYGYRASKMLDLPLVGSFHTDPAAVFGSLISTESEVGKVATRLTWKYLIKLYNRCDSIIAPSEWAKGEILARGIRGNVEVVPNGIDTKKFNPHVQTDEFLEKYSIPKGKKIVLFCGRLHKKKSPETFARAAKEASGDAVFVVVGKGALEGKLKTITRGRDNVIFTGYVPEDLMPQAFAAADIFVMPSEMETQGLVLAEALASGAVGISTDVGSAREILSDELIIPNGDHQALAETIDYLLENDTERGKIAKKQRQLIEEEFSIEAMIAKLESLYKRVA